MKKYVNLVLCLIMVWHAKAQNYSMFLLSWNQDGVPASVLLRNQGTEIIDEKKYALLDVSFWDYGKYYENPKDYYRELAETVLIREEDSIVYRYHSKKGTEQAILDFHLGIGDEFTRPDGQRLVVTDRQSDDDLVTLWLHDTETEEEDVWRSDCGSLTTGYLLRGDVPDRTITNLLRTGEFGYFTLDTEHVVQHVFHPRKLTEADATMDYLSYTFEEDALHIKGRYDVSSIPDLKDHIVRCIRNGQNIYVDYDVGWYDPKYLIYGYSSYEYDITIEGFEPGVYTINDRYKTAGLELECKGKGIDDVTSIDKVEATLAKDATTIYDLTGRSLLREPKKGMYIKNGRKYLKR